MSERIDAGCNTISFAGFRGNFCGQWEWTFSQNSQPDWNSVAFHIGVCFLYHISTAYLSKLFKAKEAYKTTASPENTVTNTPTPSDNKKQRFSIWSELLEYSPASQQWLNGFKFYHNVSLSLVSFWMFILLLWSIYQDGRLDSWDSMACKTTPMSGLYGIVNFIYLITKLWEWLDSYILIVDRKPVITLHWFHHMTTFTMAAVTHNFPVGGFALINCLVHTVMYAHYASPISWARPFITAGQLLQFIVVMSIHVYGFVTPTCYDMTPVLWEWLYCQGVVFGYFLLFLKFFYDEYLAGKKKKSQ